MYALPPFFGIHFFLLAGEYLPKKVRDIHRWKEEKRVIVFAFWFGWIIKNNSHNKKNKDFNITSFCFCYFISNVLNFSRQCTLHERGHAFRSSCSFRLFKTKTANISILLTAPKLFITKCLSFLVLVSLCLPHLLTFEVSRPVWKCYTHRAAEGIYKLLRWRSTN